jgi:signal peptidase II
VGNLYDRVRWDRGVVDFLGPVDLGLWHFPIFNVADMAITSGAVLLAISFWVEEREDRAREAMAAGSSQASGAAESTGSPASTESPRPSPPSPGGV